MGAYTRPHAISLRDTLPALKRGKSAGGRAQDGRRVLRSHAWRLAGGAVQCRVQDLYPSQHENRGAQPYCITQQFPTKTSAATFISLLSAYLTVSRVVR